MSSSSKRHESSSSSNKKRRHESDEEDNRRSSSTRHSTISESLKRSIKPISKEDYFEKATEFRLWLKNSKGKYIDEISSKDSRRYFEKFVTKWNDFDLNEKYYKGLNSTSLESSDTTRYKWSFAKKLDKMEMDSVRDSVDSLTGLTRGEDKGKRRALAIGPTIPTSTFDKEELYEQNNRGRKYEKKRDKDRKEAMLDEIAPKETGREAQLAKKRALNSYHKREPSPDVELSEADLMGGDDFKARLAAERKEKDRREQRQTERREQRLAPIMDKMDQYKAKENATIEMFKKMAEEQRKRGGI